MKAAVELFQYEDNQIRTVDLPKGRWAVAADICKALDIKDVSDAVSRLDVADRGTTPIRSGKQNRNMWIVSEGGATDLVLDSRKPEARKFRRWLTHEVWPAIRDTGSYSTAPALTGPALMAAALVEAQAVLAAKDQQIAVLEAPARAWNNLADAKGNYSVAEAAKILSQDPTISIGRDRLFDFMHSKRWIFRSRNPRGGWEARQEQVDTGRLYERPARPFLNPKTGEYELPAPTVRVTVKGIAKLHELLGGSGQLSLGGAA
ncbi:phage antirepressor KilAC domain-containing protein [Rhodococcus sp. T2V]|uniref:phage antirepressor KilAC domain-containing protein n=1 Tax=Rhodococcus sp. T2V TaxID=3034164 RepID=UPI0023E29DB2|nr:phage antirepressor KilAC domain-containing protein [Rhodococcus sp. T2V]MDF3309800.1 phage antirepressor KilAC domain-containing protein [Rhodococcus sp. T2V]